MAAAQTAPVVVYLDHTAKWSGGEIALLRTLEALDRSHVTPVVLLAEDGPFAERVRALGIETEILAISEKAREVRKDSLGASALLRHAGSALAFLSYAGKVGAFAKRCGASVLHCNSLKADIYGAIAGKRVGIPVVWHIRDHIDPSYLPGPAVKVLRSMAKSVPAYVVTNSQSTTDKLFPEGTGKQRCRVAHDGLAAWELEAPEPAVTGAWKSDPPRIGILGRLVEWKGQHVFLEAARKLTAAGHKAQFVLIGAALFGEDEYADNLKKLAGPLGSQVEFLGFRRDIPELLRSLDILVHASITPEPFGQVVIEGMAEGLPVVGSDGGGVREILTDKVTGRLTPMGDSDALAHVLGELLADPAAAQTLGRAGWQHVRENFTAARNARTLEAVYDEMWAKTSGRAADQSRSAAPGLTAPQGTRGDV
jgi:glycosyltransferase involved in cell wall biosynthesis